MPTVTQLFCIAFDKSQNVARSSSAVTGSEKSSPGPSELRVTGYLKLQAASETAFGGYSVNKVHYDIYLCDQTGCIVLKSCGTHRDQVLQMIDKNVTITNGILVQPSPSEVFLQWHLDSSSMSNSAEESLPTLPVVNGPEAWRLLNIKLPPTARQLQINFAGEIIAVSEVIQIKRNCLFMISISSGVTVVIKRDVCLFWQHLIQPQKQYVITHLKPTTLQQGSRHSRVYTVTKHSKLLPLDTVTIVIRSAEEWLNDQGIRVEDFLPINVPESTNLNLITYQGKVTAVMDSGLGVFELDNSVRLYVSRVPAVHGFRHLQIGALVTVHNVHYKRSQQNPKMSLYLCVMSSTHITSYSTHTYAEPGVCSSSLAQFRYLYSLSNIQLDFLYTLRTCCQRQLQGLLSNRSIEKIKDNVLKVPALSWQPDTSGCHRNYIDEFIVIPHECGLKDSDIQEFPQYISIKHLMDNTVAQNTSRDNWSHVWRPLPAGQVLTGILTVSDVTGVIQLQDSSGIIDVVACCYHGYDGYPCCYSNSPHQHACSELCYCQKFAAGSKFICPLLNSCCLGKVVAVTKCDFVTEFEMVSDSNSGGHCIESRPVMNQKQYICLCLKDVYLLTSQRYIVNGRSDIVKEVVLQYYLHKIFSGKEETNNVQFLHTVCVEDLKRFTGKGEYKCEEIMGTDNCGDLEMEGFEAEFNGESYVEERCERQEGIACSPMDCGDQARLLTGQRIERIGPILHRHVECKDGNTAYFCRNKSCLDNLSLDRLAKTAKAKTEQKFNIGSYDTLKIPSVSKSDQHLDNKDSEERIRFKVTKRFEGELSDDEPLVLKVKPLNSPRKRIIGITSCSEVQKTSMEIPKLDLKETMFVSNAQTEESTNTSDECKSETGFINVNVKTPGELSNILDENNKMKSRSEDNEVKGKQLNAEKTLELTLNFHKNLSDKYVSVMKKDFKQLNKLLQTEHFCLLYVCKKEALTQPNDTIQSNERRQFVVEGIVLDGSSTYRKDVFQFHGTAVRWYPVLHCGAAYSLSIPAQCSPLLSSKLSHAKVEKAIQSSKVRKSYIVDELVEIERVYVPDEVVHSFLDRHDRDISSLLKIGYPDKIVDIRGLVVQRSLMSPNMSKEQSRYRQARSMHKNAYASGGFGQMCTKLLIRDLEGSAEIPIYMNHGGVSIPPGLVPGAVVRLYSLERKVAKTGSVYLRALPTTSIDILCLTRPKPTEGKTSSNPGACDSGQAPFGSLVDFWVQKVKIRCVCDILKITMVSLKCICTNCGSLVVDDACTNISCHGGEDCKLLARASIVVDDSSCVALVTMYGDDVRKLMGLSHDQWGEIKGLVNQSGEVFIQQSQTREDCLVSGFLRTLTESTLIKQTWVLTLKHKGNSSIDLSLIELDEFVQKSIDTGSERISTRCLPFLQLDCVTMETFNPAKVTMDILSEEVKVTSEGHGQ